MDQFSSTSADRKGANGASRRIYLLLREQIKDGTLAVGARTPSTRSLALELGVSRTTVSSVYEQLSAEGYLVTAARRPTRVAEHPPPPKTLATTASQLAGPLSRYGLGMPRALIDDCPEDLPVLVDFQYGATASRDFPALAWKRAHSMATLQSQSSLRYAAPEGEASLRHALQGYLARSRGLRCDADQILIVNGSQQGIELCGRMLLDPGDRFVFEDPGYLMARLCFEAMGGRAVPVAVDAHGIDTKQLIDAGAARLAYVTPSHQFPLGGVLSIGRRHELLAWARRHGAWIIEDDYDSEFRYGQRPIDALHAIDVDARVIYVGTFSKTLSPQLRLGYIVLPGELVPAFRQAKRLMDRHAPVLEQRALASLIGSGIYERHIRRVRRENERRRIALLDAVSRHLLNDARVEGTAAGLHVVLWFLNVSRRNEAALVQAIRQQGVGVYSISGMYRSGRRRSRIPQAGLVIGYASLTLAEIEQGIELMVSALRKMSTIELEAADARTARS